MPKDKKQITLAQVKYAKRLFERALQLQSDMYEFRDVVKEQIRREDLSETLEAGAFEMDLTWNNAEKVAKEMFELYKKQ